METDLDLNNILPEIQTDARSAAADSAAALRILSSSSESKLDLLISTMSDLSLALGAHLTSMERLSALLVQALEE